MWELPVSNYQHFSRISGNGWNCKNIDFMGFSVFIHTQLLWVSQSVLVLSTRRIKNKGQPSYIATRQDSQPLTNKMSLETLEIIFWHSTQLQKTLLGRKQCCRHFSCTSSNVGWREEYNPCVGKATCRAKKAHFWQSLFWLLGSY